MRISLRATYLYVATAGAVVALSASLPGMSLRLARLPLIACLAFMGDALIGVILGRRRWNYPKTTILCLVMTISAYAGHYVGSDHAFAVMKSAIIPVIRALDQYHIKNHRYPDDLEALIPLYLSSLPIEFTQHPNGIVSDYLPDRTGSLAGDVYDITLFHPDSGNRYTYYSITSSWIWNE